MNRIPYGLKHTLACIFLSILTASGFAADRVVVFPTSFPDQSVLLQQFGNMLLGLKRGDHLIVYSADGPRRIAEIAVPDDPKANNPAWLRRQLGAMAGPVVELIQNLPTTGSGSVPQNLMLPDLFDEIGRNVVSALPAHQADLLVIGSWIYDDPRDAKWTMADNAYPSDATLRLSPSQSPFGTNGRERVLTGVNVHFCYVDGGSAFVSAEHEERVRRWWSLFTRAESGTPATFSFSLPTCVQRFMNGNADGQTHDLAASDGEPMMLHASTTIETAPAVALEPERDFLDDGVTISTVPPATTTGAVKVGLRWSQAIDIDLYARGSDDADWLYFGNVQSPEGHFAKDFLSGTGDTSFEYVEFERPIDLNTLGIAVNFYAGIVQAPPEGVVRISFDNQVYEAPFHLEATHGNQGQPPMDGAYWLVIDPLRVTGISR